MRNSAISILAAVYLALDLPDEQPKPSQHNPNGNQAHPQSDTTLVALNHRVLAGLLILGGDFEAGLDILVHQGLLVGMDGNARFDQLVPGLGLCQPGLAHIHAGSLGNGKTFIGLLDGPIQSHQTALNFNPCPITLVARLMASHADALGAGAKHGVRWQVNAMIGVTDNASGQTCGIKGRFVRTLFVHLGLENVAVGADILHLRGAGLLQSCGRRPRPPLRARIWLVPLCEDRVLEDPRRPGGLPHNCRSYSRYWKNEWH